MTGITGQDGAYLGRLLLDKGYEVFGGYRRSAGNTLWRLDELGIAQDIQMVPLEMLEMSNLMRTVARIQPTEVYNLAAQSFVGSSFEQPVYTSDVNGLGALRLLEAVRTVDEGIRFYQASTSEMFGKVQEVPQRESTPFYPRSPYAVSKVFAHWAVVGYREAYGMRACCGILFNHESPLRGPEFVTRKIVIGLCRLSRGTGGVLELGNVDARRDWGFAGDYVDAMWRMVQAEEASEYVIATGEQHSVAQFVEVAAGCLGFEIVWRGTGVGVEGHDRRTGRKLVGIKPEHFRPAEVDALIGDPAKARSHLAWHPSVGFTGLVEQMVEAEVKRGSVG